MIHHLMPEVVRSGGELYRPSIFVQVGLAILERRMLHFRPEVIREGICRKIAWMIPRQVVYWCVIRAWAHATTGEGSHGEVGAISAHDVLKRWETE